MKTSSLWAILTACLFYGCAQEQPAITYHEPLTSPGGEFSRLPPAVQNSVRAEAGMAEIQWISKHDDGGQTIYEVGFKNHDVYPPLYLASDGSVLSSNLTVVVGASKDTIEASTGSMVGNIRMDDVPASVIETIRRSAPTSEVDNISRFSSKGNMIYEVTFKNPASHPRLFVGENGRLVQ